MGSQCGNIQTTENNSFTQKLHYNIIILLKKAVNYMTDEPIKKCLMTKGLFLRELNLTHQIPVALYE